MQETLNKHILDEIRELRGDMKVLHHDLNSINSRFVELEVLFREDVTKVKKRTRLWGGGAGGIVATVVSWVFSLLTK